MSIFKDKVPYYYFLLTVDN